MFFFRLRRNESGELERRRREGRTGGRADYMISVFNIFPDNREIYIV